MRPGALDAQLCRSMQKHVQTRSYRRGCGLDVSRPAVWQTLCAVLEMARETLPLMRAAKLRPCFECGGDMPRGIGFCSWDCYEKAKAKLEAKSMGTQMGHICPHCQLTVSGEHGDTCARNPQVWLAAIRREWADYMKAHGVTPELTPLRWAIEGTRN